MSLANRSEGLGEAAILNCFISGLKVDIKRDVMALSPPTLLRAVALTKLYEDKYQPNKSSPVTHTSRYTHPSFVTSSSAAVVTRLLKAPVLPQSLCYHHYYPILQDHLSKLLMLNASAQHKCNSDVKKVYVIFVMKNSHLITNAPTANYISYN